MAVRDSKESIAAYMHIYRRKRYKRIMQEIIIFLGGKCIQCGSKEKLETDHIDRKTKLFNISTGIETESLKALWKEVKKCQLLCNNCHTKKSIKSGDIKIAVHGSFSMYDKRRHGCRCEICIKAHRQRSKIYKQRLKQRKVNPIGDGTCLENKRAARP